MNQFLKCAKMADIIRLSIGRTLFVRSGDARFKITKSSFIKTMKHIDLSLFEIEFSNTSLYIERVEQVKGVIKA